MAQQEDNYVVVGLFPDSPAAETAAHHFRHVGFGDQQLQVVQGEHVDTDMVVAEHEARQTRDEVVHDAKLGAGAGGALGLVGAAAAGAAATPLFLTAPVLAPLLAGGYGAVLGGTVAAAAGLRLKHSELSQTLRFALEQGFAALVVHSDSLEAQRRAEATMEGTTAERTLHG